MKNAPFGAAGEAMPTFNRTAIMHRAWMIFQANRRSGRPFDRVLFAQCLRAAWGDAKRHAEYDREQAAPVALIVVSEPPMSPMDAALDALKYLPAHMSYTRAANAVRASFAATV